MLVLSRKEGEIIRIGDDVKIMLVAIQGDKCRIGIEAPKDVRVLRAELWEAMQSQQEEAAADGHA